MFVTLFDTVPKPSADQSKDEEVKHHPDGSPINVGLAVVPQTEGRNGIDPEIEVGVFFDFDFVIFHTLIGIENSRNQGKCEVVLEQLSILIRNGGWDILYTCREILQVSNPAKGALKNISTCFIGQFKCATSELLELG